MRFLGGRNVVQQNGLQGQNQFGFIVSKTCCNFLGELVTILFHFKWRVHLKFEFNLGQIWRKHSIFQICPKLNSNFDVNQNLFRTQSNNWLQCAPNLYYISQPFYSLSNFQCIIQRNYFSYLCCMLLNTTPWIPLVWGPLVWGPLVWGPLIMPWPLILH